MSKVTMPEPDFHVIIRRIPRYLFSADQMEAYAATKVREALEEAAKVCDEYWKAIEPSNSPYDEGRMDAADTLEQRIEELISQ